MNVNSPPAPLDSQNLDQTVTLDLPERSSQLLRADSRTAGCNLTWSPTPTWKRAIDIVGSACLLVVLTPLLVAIAVYIRAISYGPAIFKQSRLGEMGRPFTIYKFRTMHSGNSAEATSIHREYVSSLAELDEVVAKPDLSHLLIPGGAFLRQHSLDELPQLVNVLIGNMSLIGPRPDVLAWEDYTPNQRKRFEVKPGISGLWQVCGKNRLSFSKMMELDLEYVKRRSFKLDLWIAFRTIKLILSKDNC